MPESKAAECRFAYGLFCDDIRLEVGNKVTIVGVYSSDMFLQEIPTFLPRLAVSIFAVTPFDQPVKVAQISVQRGDDVILQAESTIEQAPAAPPSTEGHDAVTRGTLAWHLPLPPMTIGSPCTLRAVVNLDGVEYIAAKLRIGVTPQSDAPSAQLEHFRAIGRADLPVPPPAAGDTAR